MRPRRSLSGIPILSPARPLRHRPCRPFSAAALSALALALQRNRHPVLTSRFCDEKLPLRQSRGCMVSSSSRRWPTRLHLLPSGKYCPRYDLSQVVPPNCPHRCRRRKLAPIRNWHEVGASDTQRHTPTKGPLILVFIHHSLRSLAGSSAAF